MPTLQLHKMGLASSWSQLAGIVLAITGCLVPLTLSAAPDGGSQFDDGYGDAFVHYTPYIKPRPPEAAASAPPVVATKATPAQAASAPGLQRVDVAWLRKAYPLLQDRAINDPTDENVAAEQYVQRIIVDKSQRYAEARMRVVQADPLLNENNRVPTASLGARTVANANLEAQDQAVRELAGFGGLLVFVDGSCRFCAMQLPILDMLRADFGLQALVISLDGALPKGFKGSVLRDNGMFRKLRLTLTPSIVYVPRPQSIAGSQDPNRYLVVAQGFYTRGDLVKQIALAGHQTKLLSSSVMADLAVWERGVASTEDLATLRLDVNDPKTIKQSLQPLLLKQYSAGR